MGLSVSFEPWRQMVFGIKGESIKGKRLLLESLGFWYHVCTMMKGGVAGSPLLSKC